MSQSRRKRIRHYNEPGHAHELTFSCFRNIPLLDTEQTCLWLAQSIDAARRGHQFQLWGYVFMPEHVHLMVWPVRAQYSIARILLSIKLPMARKALAYLRKTRSVCLDRLAVKRGARTVWHFWQPGPGYDRNVRSAAAAGRMVRYMHANPVRRGLVSRSEDWKWSSAACYAGVRPVPLEVDPVPGW
ncbi:MAG: hypothetical protein KAX80_15985 [Planctomycetes bacterium]|nr:hypothetical protein [Planctomycetota bacterium]